MLLFYIQAIPARTPPAIAHSAQNGIRDAELPVCSIGAGGIEEAAFDNVELEVSSVDAVAIELCRVLATVDDTDECGAAVFECVARSVVSLGRYMVVLEAPYVGAREGSKTGMV